MHTPHPSRRGGTGDNPARARGGAVPFLPNRRARYGPAASRHWRVRLNKGAAPREGQEDFQEVLEDAVGCRACALAPAPLRGAAAGWGEGMSPPPAAPWRGLAVPGGAGFVGAQDNPAAAGERDGRHRTAPVPPGAPCA